MASAWRKFSLSAGRTVTPVAVAEHHLIMRPRPPPAPGAAVELLQAPDEEAGEAEQPHTEPEKRAEPGMAHPVALATRLAIHRRPSPPERRGENQHCSLACLKPEWSRCTGSMLCARDLL